MKNKGTEINQKKNIYLHVFALSSSQTEENANVL